MKKFVAGMLIASSILTYSGPILTANALAPAPIGVPTNDAVVSYNTMYMAGLGTSELSQTFLEWAKKLLTQQLKKALLDYLVDRVINYINGNKDGGSFIGDWQGYMSDVAASALQGGLAAFSESELGLKIDICAPFAAQLKIGLALPAVQSFKHNLTCSFDKIGQNIDNFYADFKKGDWISYQTSFEPQNNAYGAYLAGSLLLDGHVAKTQVTSLAEAIGGSGFLGKKECDAKDPTKCKIVTPGKIVGDAVTKAIGTDIDFIVNADDLTAYVGAITNAIIGRVLTEGLSALKPSKETEGFDGYFNVKSIQRNEYQQFIKERSRLTKDIRGALSERESAQLIIDNASSTWLKFTHGNENLADEAARQVKYARDVLLYEHNEISKVTRKTQLRKSTSKLCEASVGSVNKVVTVALPQIRKKIDLANELIDTLTIADDAEPLNLPRFALNGTTTREWALLSRSTEGFSDDWREIALEQLLYGEPSDLGIYEEDFDPTEEDNADQAAILREAQKQIDDLIISNSSSTQALLGEIRNAISDDALGEAQAFKRAMRRLDDQVANIFKIATAYANRMSVCFVPYDPSDTSSVGVVTPWAANVNDNNPDPAPGEISDRPMRPFPWESEEGGSFDSDENSDGGDASAAG